ncbi:MAG: hypothetical protein KA123_00395 [Candidatus Eisenbacteria bacterium]|nr:hypothetical protein [Candidatus Eisenbacteria bacterium]
MDRWFTQRDSLEFLLNFQEIYGASNSTLVLAVKDEAAQSGYSGWVDTVRFIASFGPQETLVPAYDDSSLFDVDGKFYKWVYDWAKVDIYAARMITVYHNMHDYGVDWLLRDIDGDKICPWVDSLHVLVNISPWCPLGQWDGQVSKLHNGNLYNYDFGSSASKTFTEWFCTTAKDSLFLNNDHFSQAFRGIQMETCDRGLPCWAGHKPSGDPSSYPDPKNDGIGLPCGQYGHGPYEDSTRCSFDSLLNRFARPIRDAGFLVRMNGHALRWALEFGTSWQEDTLITQTFMGGHLEDYSTWGGWPYYQTGPIWFQVYEGLETYYHPCAVDSLEGWDISTIESRTDTTCTFRDQYTRCNLGQALMGDGCFAGQAWNEDPAFQKYLAGNDAFAPHLIEEMRFKLGHAIDDYHTFTVYPDPLSPGVDLYYRQFRRPDLTTFTVVVNVHDEDLAGVPARDAQWYTGRRSQFPQPTNRLVFDHWSKVPGTKAISHGQIDNSRVRYAPLQCSVRFYMNESASIQIGIYDLAGRRVRTPLEGVLLSPGPHEFIWDRLDDQNRPVPSGVYLIRLSGRAKPCVIGRFLVVR